MKQNHFFLPIFLSLSLLLSRCKADAIDFALCTLSQYRCGDNTYDISFPFRLAESMPDYCGSEGFDLNCTANESLTISISGESYQVKSIDYTTNVLTVVDPVLFSGNQPCPQRVTNTTLDFSPFTYAAFDLNLTFFSNCSSPFTFSWLFPVNCTEFGHSNYNYYSLNETPIIVELLQSCSSVGVFAINQTAASNLLEGGRAHTGDIRDVLQGGFGVNWTSAGTEWCGVCQSSGGMCGNVPGSSSAPNCFCPNGMVSFGNECKQHGLTNGHQSPKKSWRKEVFIGVGGGLFVCLCLIAFLLYYKKSCDLLVCWKKKSKTSPSVESVIQKCGSLNTKWYSYSEVKRITKSFSYKLGQGGFGIVYKGSLPDGHLVAVKVLTKSKENGEEFINEVASISRTSHINIVRLLGFCLDGSKRALIYDFMPNGSLERFIFNGRSQIESTLGWNKLFEIIVGVARGLEYLHRGCNTRIVHFDIKPHNILLDRDFCPKISDFGLAKLYTSKESIISLRGARGTIGYIAPEVFSRNFGVVSSKSDVYSYGMMVLEIVGGRKNLDVTTTSSSETYFPHYLYRNINHYCIEACGDNGEATEIVRKMILVALWCIQTMPDDRPSMSRVVNMLEGDISDLELPPKP